MSQSDRSTKPVVKLISIALHLVLVKEDIQRVNVNTEGELFRAQLEAKTTVFVGEPGRTDSETERQEVTKINRETLS